MCKWVKSCDTCQSAKNPVGKTAGPLGHLEASRPWDLLCVDLIGKLPKSHAGNYYVLTVIDVFSRYTKAFAIKDKSAEAVADNLKELFLRMGIPNRILSDQGKEFVGTLNAQLFRSLGIKHCCSSPEHPQGNGMIERYNRTIKDQIRKLGNSRQTNWEKLLPALTHAHRVTPMAGNSYSPFELIFGRKPELGFVDNSTFSEEDWMLTLWETLEELHQLAKKKNTEGHRKAEKHHRGKPRNFKPGDLVLVHSNQTPKGKSRKLTRRWTGPYRVVNMPSKQTVQVCHINNPGKDCTFNLARVKPYVGRDDAPLADDEYEVEDLLDCKESDGERIFLVRWKGYTPCYDSWVYEKDLNAPDLVRSFFS